MGRWRDDEGAMSPEYVAVVLVVGGLVAAILALALPTTVGDWGTYAVCRLFGDGACTRPGDIPPLADGEYEPDRCDVSTSSYSGTVEGSVLVFDASKGILFARTDRSDGTTTFTVVDDGSLGVSAEVGVEGAVPGAQVDVGAEAAVKGVAELGSTWVVGTDEANDFQGQLLEEVGEDAVKDSVPVVGGLVNWLADRANGEVREPDITYAAAGVQADAEASASADVFGEQVAGASVGVSGAVRLGVEQDRTEGKEDEWSNTTYFQVDLSAEGEIGLLTAQAEGSMATTQIMKVKRDLDGRLMEIELVNSVSNAAAAGFGDLSTENLLRSADESSVVQTIKLPATNDQERQILEDWLREGASPQFDALAHQRGQQTIIQYDGNEFGLSLGGEVALGVKLGLKGEFDQLDNEVTDAWYYGAPDASGVRSPVPFTGCLEALGS